MVKRYPTLFLILLLMIVTPMSLLAQEDDGVIFGDMSVDAPELARRGSYAVGLREMAFTNQVPDVYSGETIDRTLTALVWYPASLADGAEEMTTLTDSNIIEGFTYQHRASLDAAPNPADAPYPLIIISHGLGGSRFQLTYLGDNLASKGYVVVAIDHDDPGLGPEVILQSLQVATLYRPIDIRFMMDEMQRLNETDGFLKGMVDASNVGLVGYSYGGYGVLVAAGAALSDAILNVELLIPERRAEVHSLENLQKDERIRAVFAFAPFGMDLNNLGLPIAYWDDAGLANLDVPLFIMVGSRDDVARYETGSVVIFEKAVNSPRYLLTMLEARHNIAPNPPPPAATVEQFYRHAEAVWRSDKLNNISQHFVTAFMGINLKDADYGRFLALSESPYDVAWAGFPERSATGMTFQVADGGQ